MVFSATSSLQANNFCSTTRMSENAVVVTHNSQRHIYDQQLILIKEACSWLGKLEI